MYEGRADHPVLHGAVAACIAHPASLSMHWRVVRTDALVAQYFRYISWIILSSINFFDCLRNVSRNIDLPGPLINRHAAFPLNVAGIGTCARHNVDDHAT